MRRFATACAARPEAAWSLLARPARWPEWAPHVRGAWGLGAPEVVLGARGAARLLGAIPVPARIVEVRPGRSWAWRVGAGLVRMDHRVEVEPGGCALAIEIEAPGPLERAIALAYGPVVQATLERLARRAEAGG